MSLFNRKRRDTDLSGPLLSLRRQRTSFPLEVQVVRLIVVCKLRIPMTLKYIHMSLHRQYGNAYVSLVHSGKQIYPGTHETQHSIDQDDLTSTVCRYEYLNTRRAD
jgi:hypothetical protein